MNLRDRNRNHHDNWETPKYLLEELNREFEFDFDPCPLNFDLIIKPEDDGLLIDWGKRNFINPPYSRKLKELFVQRAIEECKQGKLCVLLIPVSTSSKLFHEYVLPNATEIRYIRGRVPFIGINNKGVYCNWHLTDRKAPEGVKHTKDRGMFDSMIVILDGRCKDEF